MKNHSSFYRHIFSFLLIILSFSLFSQNENFDYKSAWQRAEIFQKAGLPISALGVVDSIQKTANFEKNDPQMIRAILFSLKMKSEFEEQYLLKAITTLTNILPTVKTPAKEVIWSLKGELLSTYLANNRYSIFSNDDSPTLEKIETWSIDDFKKAISECYNNSLENSTLLKTISIDEYSAILEKEDNLSLRPTLFDLIAWRALEYFSNPLSEITVFPIDNSINSEIYFSPVKSFSKAQFPNENHSTRALKIYQEILLFHLTNKNNEALIDANHKRLEYAHSICFNPKDDSLYKKSLEAAILKYQESEIVTKYYYSILSVEKNSAKKLELCEKAISLFPKSEGALLCEREKIELLRPELSIVTDMITLPNKKSLAFAQFRNVDTIYCSIFSIEQNELSENNRNRRKNEFVIPNKKPVKKWSFSVPVTTDLERHSIEFVLPELEEGAYRIFIQTTKQKKREQIISTSTFQVSNLSVLQLNRSNTTTSWESGLVLNRDSGLPISDATIEFWTNNAKKGSWAKKAIKKGETKSDKNGKFTISKEDFTTNYFRGFLKIFSGSDTLVQITNSNFYNSSNRNKKEATKLFIYTDRAIYRPGQTIYFSAVAMIGHDTTWKLSKSEKIPIRFNDANGKLLVEKTFLTNKWGKINGSFSIPPKGLNGGYQLYSANGRKSVQVESYKRPKFQAKMASEKAYKPGDSITILGNATAFSLYPISNATVKYSVNRELIIPYNWQYFRTTMPWQQQKSEISNGEIFTDKNGDFKIHFKSLSENNLPTDVFYYSQYQIDADITDIAGETHNISYTIRLGKNPLLIKTNLKDFVNLENEKNFLVWTTDLNNNKILSKSKIEIYALENPTKLHTNRLWQFPEFMTLPEDEFQKEFPDFLYKKEQPENEWKKTKKVLSKELKSVDSVIYLKNSNKWKQGKYLVEISAQDKNGNESKLSKVITCYSPKRKTVFDIENFYAQINKTEAVAGEKIDLLIGSAAKNLNIYVKLFRKDSLIIDKNLTLSHEQKNIEIPIQKADRGGLKLIVYAVKDSRFYSENFTIDVPFDNKELKIKLTTFRNKLKPNEEETWKIKISDYKNRNVQATMVATLYDASLDLISQNYWSFLELPKNYCRASISGNTFYTKRLNSKLFNQKNFPEIKPIKYPQIFWFNYPLSGNLYRLHAEKGGMRAPLAVTSIDDDKVMGTMDGKNSNKKEEQTSSEEKHSKNIRKNLNETAFFYPNLVSNDNGEISIDFTVPESLTQWRFMALAFTPELQNSSISETVTTQKELMIVPNLPRFLRQGDSAIISATVINLSPKKITATPELIFQHPVSNKILTEVFKTNALQENLTIEAGESAVARWTVLVPENAQSVVCQISAKSENHSDGEEKLLVILPNKMQITDALSFIISPQKDSTFVFSIMDSLFSKVESSSMTLEFAENPAWYAVSALPYLSEPRQNSSNQIFNALFSEILAQSIVSQNPKISEFYASQKATNGEALLSPLSKNKELKNILLDATPFANAAISENEQIAALAQLFDKNRSAEKIENLINQLEFLQKPNGGFSWYPGGNSNIFIVQEIVAGIGKIIRINPTFKEVSRLNKIAEKAIIFLDNEIWQKRKKEDELLSKNQNFNGSYLINYLYARSFWIDKQDFAKPEQEKLYYQLLDTAISNRNNSNFYLQALLGHSLLNVGENESANKIVKSLSEHSLYSEKLGRYWRNNSGWFWYNDDLSRQAILISLFSKVGKKSEVEQMKKWLIVNKRTNCWDNNRATAEACFALLATGEKVLSKNAESEIYLGQNLVETRNKDVGTGYFKKIISGAKVDSTMSKIRVKNSGSTTVWGSLYWQYEQNLEDVISSKGDLYVERQYFVEKQIDGKTVSVPVEKTSIFVGDRIKIKLFVSAEQSFEFVHLQDLRPANLEPVDQISTYRWDSKTSYYFEIKDASVNLFFDYLPKGKHHFEYEVFVTEAGNFSAGPAQIQSVYAPSFTAHSEGFRLRVGGE